jgi:hypothetical protein
MPCSCHTGLRRHCRKQYQQRDPHFHESVAFFISQLGRSKVNSVLKIKSGFIIAYANAILLA